MLGVTTDTATMEIGAGVSITAGGCAGKGKAEKFSTGGKHGMFASGGGSNRGDRSFSDCLISLAIGREVTRGTTSKTAGTSALAD